MLRTTEVSVEDEIVIEISNQEILKKASAPVNDLKKELASHIRIKDFNVWINEDKDGFCLAFPAEYSFLVEESHYPEEPLGYFGGTPAFSEVCATGTADGREQVEDALNHFYEYTFVEPPMDQQEAEDAACNYNS